MTQITSNDSAGKAILVIDDDPGILKIIDIILSDEGYTVLTANGGNAGLAMLEKETPHRIILDYMMPDLNAVEFMRIMQERGLQKGTPIILITADGQAEEKMRAVGAQGYILKPFDIDELQRIVDCWFRPSERRSSDSAVGEVAPGE